MSDDARLWQAVADLRRRLADLEAMEYAGHALTAGDADTVDTLHASAVAAANTLLALDAASKLPASITGDADTVDSLHAATSGANAHVLATDASGNVRVDGHLLMPTPGQRRMEVAGTNATRYGMIEALIRKQLVDNSATAVFKITTVDEAVANTDAGAYAVFVEGLVHASSNIGSTYEAMAVFREQFGRAMKATGSGQNTIASRALVLEPAHTDAGVREIGSGTITIAETSEYVQTVSLTIDVTGSNEAAPIVTLFVRLVWGSFTTAPVLAVV